MKSALTFIFTLILAASPTYAGIEISPLLKFQKNNSDKVLYVGGVNLPAKGFWRIKEIQNSSADSEIYLFKEKSSTGPEPDQTALSRRYNIVTLRQEKDASTFSLIIFNAQTGEIISLTLNPAQAEQGDETIVDQLKLARMFEWRPYLLNAPSSPALQTWHRVNDKKRFDNFLLLRQSAQRRQETQLSVFGFLGGRAAVEETLQLQEIATPIGQSSEQEVPVSSIQSVTVDSHPFAEMLGSAESENLPLAELAPPDRFFVYTSKPKAILPFLDEGAGFISDFGGILQATGIKYNLKQKYLKRLGLDNKWLKMFIDSGVVKETALLFPDLFFIDGTDVTVVSRLASGGLIASLIKLVGVTGLTNDNIATRVLPGNKKVFWALRNDILVFSTSRKELNAVLTLHANQGENSLGRSAEFRYMLTQLDHTKDTRFYAYFSDPFIRQLVGPATKIAQRRRLLARKDLEIITSGALLAKLDGLANPDSLKALVSGGYIPGRFDNGDYSINQDFKARSKIYGTVALLNTLNENPVINASAYEAASYKQYVDNYNRYWRRFFDPIAIRIEDQSDGSLETTLFILPLIDNTIYNTLREILAVSEDNVKLMVPMPSPLPVTMLSLNLREKQWLDLSKQYLGLFQRYTRMRSTFLDDLGPGLHLAIHDADPVIALGSGDILGAFGADSATSLRGGGALMIPAALSLLTRPCTLYIETGNPDKTRKHLQRATSSTAGLIGRDEGFGINFYQLDGLDEWIYSFDFFGLVKLRYGIEIQDNYLVIRNIPWTSKEKIERVSEVPLNGAMLQSFPQACKIQLPGLFTSAQENSRKAVMEGMSYLYPLVASGYADIDTAADKHLLLYGFQPVHPGNGYWLWNDRKLISSLYGSAGHQKQPAYTAGDSNFGLLRGIESLSLNMQFEDTGLRSSIRWKLR